MIRTIATETDLSESPWEPTDRPADEDDAMIARYIESDPLNLGPSEAQVVDHGASVWALMTYLHSVGDDNRTLIDARIALNRSYFTS